MKNVMVVWFALAGVVGFCHAMDYSDDDVRQLIEEKNWEHIVYQVSQGKITPQQLSSHRQLNLNLLDTNGRPLVYHLVRALSQNYTSMGVSQTLMNDPNWGSYHTKGTIKNHQSAARHLLAAIVHLLKLQSLDIKYWFITPEDGEATQISYSALYQMIVEQNNMNAIEAAPQTSSNIFQYTPLQLGATITLCIMGGGLALVGLRWYYYQPEEGDETDANTEVKS